MSGVVRCGGAEIGREEVERRARAIAGFLERRGVAAGARIALAAGNGLAFVLATHGVLARGGTLVPLPVLFPGDVVGALARRARAAFVLHDAAHEALARTIGPEAASVEEAEAALPLDPLPTPPGDAPAAILFTSGTTGAPRAAILTFANLAASAAASAARLGTGPGDTWLACLPLYHVGGLAILLRAARDGSSVEVHERFDPRAVAAALASGRVTCASLVARALDRTLETARAPFAAGLRAVLVGGGPAPEALLARARAAGLPVARTYGLTEVGSQVATQRPGDADETCGRPVEGVEVAIDDGEVLVRGAAVMAGYDGEPARAGWLRTGDLGRIDGEGRLTILGRRSEVIVTGGEKVSPARVEATLLAHPAVEDACVVGIPDPSWGSRVCAAVRVRAGGARAGAEAGPAEILRDVERHCRARLARFEVPRAIVPLAAPLPRNAAGKLLRGEVARMLGASI